MKRDRRIKLEVSLESPEGKAYSLYTGVQRFVVGRTAGEVRLDDEKASRRHAAIEYMGGNLFLVKDLQSTNGISRDGTTKVASIVVRSGEHFFVGGTKISLILHFPLEPVQVVRKWPEYAECVSEKLAG